MSTRTVRCEVELHLMASLSWVEETCAAAWGGARDAAALADRGAAAAGATQEEAYEDLSAFEEFVAAFQSGGAHALDDALAAATFASPGALAQANGRRRCLLHVVARADDGDAVAVAVAHGAAVDAPAADGNTPLHDAAYYGCWRAAATLVERGANGDAENANGETVVACAWAGGHSALASAIEKGLAASVSPNVCFIDYASRERRKIDGGYREHRGRKRETCAYLGRER